MIIIDYLLTGIGRSPSGPGSIFRFPRLSIPPEVSVVLRFPSANDPEPRTIDNACHNVATYESTRCRSNQLRSAVGRQLRSMEHSSALRLKFWGVRGTIPTPAASHLGYGGNTTCLEARSSEGVIMIDAGTGCRNLGAHLQEEFAGASLKLHVLMTHFHWDHIQGLPHFAPLYSPTNQVIFHSSHPPEQIRQILEGQMSHPYYPISLHYPPAQKDFVDICSTPFRHFGMAAHPFPLEHPQGATGYRIESNGKVITHASDFEHGHDKLDKTLREFAQNADVLVYDAQYTPKEYVSKKGYGHSTWLEATRVARDSHVDRLILFHHDPNHDDQCMTEIVKEARRYFENTDAAKEGLEIAV